MNEGLPGWVLHEKDGLKSYSVPDSERFLDWISQHGFLLHGSPFAIRGCLEPRRSRGEGRVDERAGVYLTDFAPLAIFCALVEKVPETLRTASITRQRDNGVSRYEHMRLGVDSAERLRDHGYVYIVPSEVAEGQRGGDLICFREVEPSLVIRVTRSDLRYEVKPGR